MPRRRLTPYPLLGLLAEQPLSGYDLRRAIQATFGHFWAESYGQIYPELRRLAAAGLVEAVPETVGGAAKGASRKLFRLTVAGEAELASWMQEPAAGQVLRNEMLLKLYFAGSRRPETIRTHLSRRREELGQRLAILARIEERLRRVLADSPGLAGWLVSVRHGVLLGEAELAWCREAEALLGTAPQGRPAP
jgi:DNA-binding PadR family transcriptional regulator